jgi:hypothetical protein
LFHAGGCSVIGEMLVGAGTILQLVGYRYDTGRDYSDIRAATTYSVYMLVGGFGGCLVIGAVRLLDPCMLVVGGGCGCVRWGCWGG